MCHNIILLLTYIFKYLARIIALLTNIIPLFKKIIRLHSKIIPFLPNMSELLAQIRPVVANQDSFISFPAQPIPLSDDTFITAVDLLQHIDFSLSSVTRAFCFSASFLEKNSVSSWEVEWLPVFSGLFNYWCKLVSNAWSLFNRLYVTKIQENRRCMVPGERRKFSGRPIAVHQVNEKTPWKCFDVALSSNMIISPFRFAASFTSP